MEEYSLQVLASQHSVPLVDASARTGPITFTPGIADSAAPTFAALTWLPLQAEPVP